MADVGRVLVVSCSSFISAKDIINEMFKTETPEPTLLSDSLNSYPWRIENKYYTADIHLCSCSVSSLPPQCEFAADVNFQSIIIVFDKKETSSFKEVISWLSYIKSQNPSVLLLLNSGKGENKGGMLTEAELAVWCLNYSFELIDMICEEEDEDDDEEVTLTQTAVRKPSCLVDDFREKTGIDRVVEALQCARWPNMKMREYQGQKAANISSDNQGANALSNNEDCSKESSKNGASESEGSSVATGEKPAAFPLPTDDLELLSSLAIDGAENESFEELFQKLAVMKERASSLPANERKDYAEKVAMAFWRAMGGSEDEIAGLGEDDDN